MSLKLLSGVAALSFLLTPAMAQTSTETPPAASTETGAAATAAPAPTTDAGTADAAADQDARDRAVQNAQGLGMQNVTVMDRVFVVQGTTPQGETVFMIVNPPGALIGLGGPVNTQAAAPTGGAQTPAVTPYQATQMQPATPQMWDPESLETRLTELGFSDFADMKQEGNRVSLSARKDNQDVMLVIDLQGGEIWDDAQQPLGSLNDPAVNPAN